MCWNAPVSFITFLIGTVLNFWLVYSIREPVIYMLAIFWQWILFMQIFEGIFWSTDDPKTAKMATMGANLNSMLQPAFFVLLMLIVSPVSIGNKIVAIFGIIFYFGYMISRLINGDSVSQTLAPQEGCVNLNLNWSRTLKYTGFFYVFLIVLGGVLLLRPVNFMLIIMGYILGIMLISMYIYSCGMASMWCWFAALAPLITYFAWKVTH